MPCRRGVGLFGPYHRVCAPRPQRSSSVRGGRQCDLGWRRKRTKCPSKGQNAHYMPRSSHDQGTKPWNPTMLDSPVAAWIHYLARGSLCERLGSPTFKLPTSKSRKGKTVHELDLIRAATEDVASARCFSRSEPTPWRPSSKLHWTREYAGTMCPKRASHRYAEVDRGPARHNLCALRDGHRHCPG